MFGRNEKEEPEVRLNMRPEGNGEGLLPFFFLPPRHGVEGRGGRKKISLEAVFPEIFLNCSET